METTKWNGASESAHSHNPYSKLFRYGGFYADLYVCVPACISMIVLYSIGTSHTHSTTSPIEHMIHIIV